MSAECRVVRWHNCPRTHPTFRALARCIWPDAQWILGEGPYVTVRGCNGLTVLLHSTLADAQLAFGRIHVFRPKGGCDHTKHELAVLVLPDGGGS